MTPEMKLHRQARLAARFVALADTLVDDFDVAEVLDDLMGTCIDLLDVDAAGLLLTDTRGSLQRVSSSNESAQVLELLQLETREGPCVDAVRQSKQIVVADIAVEGAQWPAFSAAATAAGFAAVYAFPMRLRDATVGGLNLFSKVNTSLDSEDRMIAQALADVATIGILQQRSLHRSTLLAENLQRALNTRIVIEQAKGVLAEHGGVPMEKTFALLRAYARKNRVKLSDVAHSVVYPPHIAAAVISEATPSDAE